MSGPGITTMSRNILRQNSISVKNAVWTTQSARIKKGDMDRKILDKTFLLVQEQEKRFLKQAVFLFRAYAPKPWWHMLIPFKFVLEYLARKKAYRSFSKTYLHLKQIALDAAYQDLISDSQAESEARLEARLREYWLQKQPNMSQELYTQLHTWLDLLRGHYLRMLQSRGRHYHDLLAEAYPSKQAYSNFVKQLTLVEEEMDPAVFRTGQADCSATPDLDNQRKAFAQVRERELREAFD